MNGIDVSQLTVGVYTHAGSIRFGVDCQPELVRPFFIGLLQLVDSALVPLDFCSPN
jgi:hypothetical protein